MPVMTVEQRWNADGRMMWCVVQDGIPYAFGSGPEDELYCDGVVRRHPNGMGSTGCTPDTEYEFHQQKGCNAQDVIL